MGKVSSMFKIDWVEIPAGRFIIGVDDNRQNLFLDKFYIGRFPVTNAQMYEFLASNHRYSYKSTYPTDTISLGKKQTLANEKGNHPADTSWHLAGAFCDWIDARLPTVAEWEKAARGTDGRNYPWGNQWDITRGNFVRPAEARKPVTTPVDQYPTGQSPFGLYDVAGNTFEFTCNTMFDDGTKGFTEMAVLRSYSCDFPADGPLENLARVHLVTRLSSTEMYAGGYDLTGFRPVMDTWRAAVWPGFASVTFGS
jgi:formylglycine-generating enzyme required for sulfatase activity